MCHMTKCLQDRDEANTGGAFSLRPALFDVLVDNKEEFVYLFMGRVDVEKFLHVHPLGELYKQVFKIACIRILCMDNYAVYCTPCPEKREPIVF